MRSKHVFDRGIAPKEEFLGGYAYHNRFLVSRFGSFPVDAIWLSEDTRGIIVYGNDPRQDRDAIIASDEPSKPHKHRSMARLFPLHPPGEWITEVVAQEYRRSVTVSPHWPCLAYPGVSPTNRCLASSKQTGIVNFKWGSSKAGMYS